jgi:hypothetical protein
MLLLIPLSLRKRECSLTCLSQYINHSYTYTCISSKNPTLYTATGSTIKCTPITYGKHKGHTLLQYSGEYSNDAGTGMCNEMLGRPALPFRAKIFVQRASNMP